MLNFKIFLCGGDVAGGGEFQGPPSESNPVLGLYWVVIQYLMKYWLHTTSEYAHTLKLIVYEENRAMFSPHILWIASLLMGLQTQLCYLSYASLANAVPNCVTVITQYTIVSIRNIYGGAGDIYACAK